MALPISELRAGRYMRQGRAFEKRVRSVGPARGPRGHRRSSTPVHGPPDPAGRQRTVWSVDRHGTLAKPGQEVLLQGHERYAGRVGARVDCCHHTTGRAVHGNGHGAHAVLQLVVDQAPAAYAGLVHLRAQPSDPRWCVRSAARASRCRGRRPARQREGQRAASGPSMSHERAAGCRLTRRSS